MSKSRPPHRGADSSRGRLLSRLRPSRRGNRAATFGPRGTASGLRRGRFLRVRRHPGLSAFGCLLAVALGAGTFGSPGVYFQPATDGPLPVDGGGTQPLPDDLLIGQDPAGQPGVGLPGVPGSGLPATEGRPHVDAVVLDAYRDAAAWAARTDPSCNLHWSLLAGIGHVESHHAAGVSVSRNGDTSPSILGPQLNGAGEFAAISDTDGGRFDSDGVWDRAVGPMQFIPSSWASMGVDGNGDGEADPNNVYDAAAGAARYLCTGDRDLSALADRKQAVFGYNHSWEYVSLVLRLAELYANGRLSVDSQPVAPGVTAPAGTSGGGTGGGPTGTVAAAPAPGSGGQGAGGAGSPGGRSSQGGDGSAGGSAGDSGGGTSGGARGGTSGGSTDRAGDGGTGGGDTGGGGTATPSPEPSPAPSPDPTRTPSDDPTSSPDPSPSDDPSPSPEPTEPGLCYSETPDDLPESVEDALENMECALPCPEEVDGAVESGAMPNPSDSPEGTAALDACDQPVPEERGGEDSDPAPSYRPEELGGDLVCWTNEADLWCVVEVPESST